MSSKRINAMVRTADKSRTTPKTAIAVAVFIVILAAIAFGSWILMMWSALMYQEFGYFGNIGFWQSVLLFLMTWVIVVSVQKPGKDS